MNDRNKVPGRDLASRNNHRSRSRVNLEANDCYRGIVGIARGSLGRIETSSSPDRTERFESVGIVVD